MCMCHVTKTHEGLPHIKTICQGQHEEPPHIYKPSSRSLSLVWARARPYHEGFPHILCGTTHVLQTTMHCQFCTNRRKTWRRANCFQATKKLYRLHDHTAKRAQTYSLEDGRARLHSKKRKKAKFTYQLIMHAANHSITSSCRPPCLTNLILRIYPSPPL